jgi:gamma-glutamyltranspeptidase/glutathione hydrolase
LTQVNAPFGPPTGFQAGSTDGKAGPRHSPHSLAAQSARAVLREGANAIEAMVAAA